ncbi:MAG: 4Fe-4S cluster-binding domain-containing protein [Dehalococcoidales bacterium]|nr:4Fe-4S cluster-binding domain-containing protein [Dehalococcoidales bacterium]
MLTGLHFLLTYMCNAECDHCFLYCSPRLRGTFTTRQIRELLDEATKIGTIEWIYYEGGEPFLFYPVMLEGVKMARERGFKVGIVTNSYFATSAEDIKLWLKPLYELGIDDFRTSNDPYHYDNEEDNPAILTQNTATEIGLPAAEIRIDKPSIDAEKGQGKGEPVIGGGTMFRGRAVEKLTAGLPRKPWKEFTTCPYEDLESLSRVHLDSFGNVHLCQGLSMGNVWETPMSKLVKNYDAASHPICGPLVKGGPALLAREYKVDHDEEYVDACHFCYLVRLKLLDKFPEYLTPRQVYGLE